MKCFKLWYLLYSPFWGKSITDAISHRIIMKGFNTKSNKVIRYNAIEIRNKPSDANRSLNSASGPDEIPVIDLLKLASFMFVALGRGKLRWWSNVWKIRWFELLDRLDGTRPGRHKLVEVRKPTCNHRFLTNLISPRGILIMGLKLSESSEPILVKRASSRFPIIRHTFLLFSD